MKIANSEFSQTVVSQNIGGRKLTVHDQFTKVLYINNLLS